MRNISEFRTASLEMGILSARRAESISNQRQLAAFLTTWWRGGAALIFRV